MKEYIEMYDYPKYMNIEKGDIVFISSDTRFMLYDAMRNKRSLRLDDFIDGLIDAVGDDGTVIFPTYNWGFCRGEEFDYNKTPCETGVLGTLALKRNDFQRTKHPIYSFAVCGYYREKLVSMNNSDSFGANSPFAFFRKMNVNNYVIDVSLAHSFTYCHYVEEQSGVVNYRFIKNFTGNYVDENGNREKRTYSMFVRNLDLDVKVAIDPIQKDIAIQEDLVPLGAEDIIKINSSEIKHIKMGEAYPIILYDILHNNSKKFCSFKGQI